jgi:putative nucleotidyltransferase-like protein
MRSKTGAALNALTALLRGEPALVTDWTALIALANRTWLTPQLYCALERAGRLADVPTEVRDYLAFIHDSNLERNRRLRAQLLEAIEAFNGIGISPTLLKGSVALFAPPAEGLGSRMTSDIDIGVEPHELDAARSCLTELGYEETAEDRGMGRSTDAGLIELRARARSSTLSREQSRLERELAVLELGGLRAKLPSATCRALHWIAHDLIKEGDYWRGRIDLRHLHDVARLEREEGIAWNRLRTVMPGGFWENALATHVLSLNHYFGVALPKEFTYGPIPRFQHWRRSVSAAHPIFGMPLRLLGNLVWGMRRTFIGTALARRRPQELVRRINRALMGTNTGPKL